MAAVPLLMTLLLMAFSIIRADNRFQAHAQEPISTQAGQRVNYAWKDLNHTRTHHQPTDRLSSAGHVQALQVRGSKEGNFIYIYFNLRED